MKKYEVRRREVETWVYHVDAETPEEAIAEVKKARARLVKTSNDFSEIVATEVPAEPIPNQ